MGNLPFDEGQVKKSNGQTMVVCLDCNMDHKLKMNPNNKLPEIAFICEESEKKICRLCSQTHHANKPCLPANRQKSVTQYFNQKNLLSCPCCLAPSILRADPGVPEEQIKMECKFCQTVVCRACAAQWDSIQAHGPSYHRPGCYCYLNFPKMKLKECQKCLTQNCIKPLDLEGLDIPNNEKIPFN